jgi:putative ABC transport system permease protein
MSLLRIAYRSIQQRGVASLLTMLSMALGVMLVVGVLSIHGIVSRSFKNNASLGYNMIVGAKGGKEQLVLNTVYYLSSPVENIPYSYYLEFLPEKQRDRLLVDSLRYKAAAALRQTSELAGATTVDGTALVNEAAMSELVKQFEQTSDLHRDGKYSLLVQMAIPLCLGDYFGRFRVVGTTPALFDDLVWDIDNNRKFEFAQGRNFMHKSPEHGYFEAVVGSTVAREMKVKLGDQISPSHGSQEGHKHERTFTVVGILKSSGTPNDRAVFVNMEGFYLMEDHAKPVEEEPSAAGKELTEEQKKAAFLAKRNQVHMELDPNPDPLPVEQREVTAILIKADTMAAIGLENAIQEGKDAQAVLPVAVIYGIFGTFVDPIRWVLLALTAIICVVSGINILVSIYNSMSERRHEIAVMRALGASRGAVMAIILLEATLLSLGGGVLGWFFGHTAGFLASPLIEAKTGVSIGFNLWSEPFIYPLQLLGLDNAMAERITMPLEVALVPALILLAILVGLWPALSAYRTDVAKSLGK